MPNEIFQPLALLLATAAALLPATAHAEDTEEAPPYSFGNETETYFLGGLTGGGSFGSPGAGGFVGGELSVAWLKELWWGGIYADGAYDFGHGAGTFTAGPEVGWGPIGLDGGAGLRLGLKDEPEVGFVGRGMITLGLFAVFGRYGYWLDTNDEDDPNVVGTHVGQVGVLVKLPFWSSAPIPEIAP
jgi:hypothetical protein